MRDWVVPAVLLLCAGASHARPIELTVVLKAPNHRAMSGQFRDAWRDETLTRMTSALDGVATVRVVDSDSEQVPQWRTPIESGLRVFERQTANDTSRTHFVILEMVGGEYRVLARQFDNSLMRPGPVISRRSVASRTEVARLTSELVLNNLGLSGRVVASDGDSTATLTPDDDPATAQRVAALVSPGDVFMLVQTRSRPALVVPHAFFIAQTKLPTGQIAGRVVSRFKDPLAGWETGEVVAVRIGAERAPVRVRLVNPNGAPAANLTVQISNSGFGKDDPVREQGLARAGVFISRETYDRIAFISILTSERVIARVPVAVVGDELTTIEVPADASGELAIVGESGARALRNRSYELAARLNEDMDALRSLMNQGKNRASLGKISEMIGRLESDIDRLAEDLARFRAANPNARLNDVDRSLDTLRQQRQALASTKSRLANAVASESSTSADGKRERLQAMVARAEQEILEADYEQALETYGEAIRQAGGWPELEARRDALAKEWALKSPAHGETRTFIYGPWAKVKSLDEALELLNALPAHVGQLRSAGDRLSARKLHRGLTRVAAWIADRDDQLRRNPTDDAPKQIEMLRKASVRVRGLLDDVEKLIREG
jgi:hypothetical protein